LCKTNTLIQTFYQFIKKKFNVELKFIEIYIADTEIKKIIIFVSAIFYQLK